MEISSGKGYEKIPLLASANLRGDYQWIQAMRVTPSSTSPAVYEALGRSLPGVGMRLCYCSVLDECWLLDSKRDEPGPVRDCKAAPTVLWGSGA